VPFILHPALHPDRLREIKYDWRNPQLRGAICAGEGPRDQRVDLPFSKGSIAHMARDNRVTLRDGTAMHTATNAIFKIGPLGTVRPIDKGCARDSDLAWITQAVLAEIKAERTRKVTGQFI
jgi:hypothetical protein